ncbi:hypothetical protein DFH07DRAFT_58611 [Mycena maculata]|uniref:Uncharacterized protein n=1 Tax=Mycena maculata TaxID=230809 RepID=A0AAD7IGK0_9AGAR|nr:hypothetical protein DFH07DRAFT_58611 [Mycena maculata]
MSQNMSRTCLRYAWSRISLQFCPRYVSPNIHFACAPHSLPITVLMSLFCFSVLVFLSLAIFQARRRRLVLCLLRSSLVYILVDYLVPFAFSIIPTMAHCPHCYIYI